MNFRISTLLGLFAILFIFSFAHAEMSVDLESKSTTYIPSIVSTDSKILNGYTSQYSVAKGDYVRVKGTILRGNDPNVLQIWTFGQDYFFYSPQIKTIDSQYEYVFQPRETAKMGDIQSSPGEYFILVQHPGLNNKMDIYLENGTIKDRNTNQTELIVKFYPPKMLLEKLKQTFNETDDEITVFPFILTQPWIKITDMENIEPTQRTTWDIESMAVKGVTNLNMGIPISVIIDPEYSGHNNVSSFYKTETKVIGSDTSWNSISFKIPLRGLTKGIHTFQIYDKNGLASLSTTFQVYEDHLSNTVISTPTSTSTTLPATEIPTIKINMTKTPKPTTIPEPPSNNGGTILIIVVIAASIFIIWYYKG
jgi:hypothetical protein